MTCSCVKQILTWPVSHIKWSGLIAMTSNDFWAMCGHIRLQRHVWCVTWATNQTTNGWWFSAFNHSILSNTLELGISPVKSAPQSSNISARVRAERKESKTRSQTAASCCISVYPTVTTCDIWLSYIILYYLPIEWWIKSPVTLW